MPPFPPLKDLYWKWCLPEPGPSLPAGCWLDIPQRGRSRGHRPCEERPSDPHTFKYTFSAFLRSFLFFKNFLHTWEGGSLYHTTAAPSEQGSAAATPGGGVHASRGLRHAQTRCVLIHFFLIFYFFRRRRMNGAPLRPRTKVGGGGVLMGEAWGFSRIEGVSRLPLPLPLPSFP